MLEVQGRVDGSPHEDELRQLGLPFFRTQVDIALHLEVLPPDHIAPFSDSCFEHGADVPLVIAYHRTLRVAAKAAHTWFTSTRGPIGRPRGASSEGLGSSSPD